MDTFSQRFSLEGKVALVTGAAYGIGFAIAEAYAKAGAKVAFNCRSEHHLQQALADYKAKGIDARGYIADVTDETQVKDLVEKVEEGSVFFVGFYIYGMSIFGSVPKVVFCLFAIFLVFLSFAFSTKAYPCGQYVLVVKR